MFYCCGAEMPLLAKVCKHACGAEKSEEWEDFKCLFGLLLLCHVYNIRESQALIRTCVCDCKRGVCVSLRGIASNRSLRVVCVCGVLWVSHGEQKASGSTRGTERGRSFEGLSLYKYAHDIDRGGTCLILFWGMLPGNFLVSREGRWSGGVRSSNSGWAIQRHRTSSCHNHNAIYLCLLHPEHESWLAL